MRFYFQKGENMARVIMVMGLDIEGEDVDCSVKFKGLDELSENEVGSLVSFVNEAMLEMVLAELE